MQETSKMEVETDSESRLLIRNGLKNSVLFRKRVKELV
jgi:hypothetical protein